jgi:hypothetical protein
MGMNTLAIPADDPCVQRITEQWQLLPLHLNPSASLGIDHSLHNDNNETGQAIIPEYVDVILGAPGRDVIATEAVICVTPDAWYDLECLDSKILFRWSRKDVLVWEMKIDSLSANVSISLNTVLAITPTFMSNITLDVNGQPVTVLDGGQGRMIASVFVMRTGGLLRFTLCTPQLLSPLSLGYNDDGRNIGIAVIVK